jgi:putative ABC transport system ATP-binding protein
VALIEVQGLTKLYRMGEDVVRALDGVDLKIERGEFLAITGASGSGKSTIMHLIGCLDRPTAGRFVFDGRDFSDLSDRQLAEMRNRQIGFVFQTFNLINRITALDNVAVPLFYARRSNTRGPALRALERVGLAQRAHHKSNELSGGERQRVAIARAIVNDPPLLLADEPTGNLDSRTGQQIMEIFRELNRQGVTIVLVTHEHEVAIQARRIVQMRDGKVVADRLASELHPQAGQDGLQVRSAVELDEPEPAVAARGKVLMTAKAAARPSAGTGVLTAEDPRPASPRSPSAGPAAAAAHRAPAESATDAGSAHMSVEPGPSAPDGASLGPRRRARGANATLILGAVALLLVLTAFALVVAAQATAASVAALDLQSMTPEQRMRHIPQSLFIELLLMVVTMLGGFVTGIVGLVVAHVARKRMRQVPGNWYGRKRIWVGFTLACVASFGPLVLIAVQLLVRWLSP